jgi:Mg-chelatase subunit ChlD
MSRILPFLLLLSSIAPAPGQDAGTPPRGLNEKDTAGVVQTFAGADSWGMQAIALLSLGTDWHPAGSAIVLQAMQSKDARLRPFGIEQLRRTDPRVFASVCTPELVAELVDHQLQAKCELVRERALAVLQRLFPQAAAGGDAMQRYWHEHQDGYAPPAWTAPPPDPDANRTVAVVQRAFDLRDAGLQVAIVIDSTLSMQPGINAARDAVNDIATILASIAPKFELGLVHYKDLCDFPVGARILEPLTRNRERVRDRLEHLVEGGGGDFPEKVDAGIEVALSKEMKWNKDSNRLILVIGDAPPHKQDMDRLLALVERAHKHPFQDPKDPPAAAPKLPLRPFIVSAIAVAPEAKSAFEQIAKAGGGTCVAMELPAASPGAPASAPRSGQTTAGEQIARHVLVLSFGMQFEPQLRAFVDTFFAYHRAGAF